MAKIKKVECPRCHRYHKPNGHDICFSCIAQLDMIRKRQLEEIEANDVQDKNIDVFEKLSDAFRPITK